MAGSALLRFVNLSDDGGSSNIVFFQKNGAAIRDFSIAWRVVRRCGYRNYCPIPYSWDTDINMVDWNDNHSKRQKAGQGDVFHITPQRHGKRLSAVEKNGHPTQVWVQNCLSLGALHVNLYRSGHLVAQQRNVIPEQWAKFELSHWLYVAVIPGIQQGAAIPMEYLSAPATEFCLHGIASADIVMHGGGQGRDATALRFEMANVLD